MGGGKGEPRVLITGGGGQLARALGALLETDRAAGPVLAPSRSELDIADRGRVREAVASFRPDWLVNCAAYNAVDQAETDREAAFRTNDEAVGVLADACAERGVRLIHVSTDYVFDGETHGVYVEDDPPRPLSVYGESKLGGEKRLLAHPVRSALLRTAWLYGESGKNFLVRIVELGKKAAASGEPLTVVADQVGCPTDVHSLAFQIEEVIRHDLRGLMHAAALGSASWYDFADAIFSGLGLRPRLVPIRAEELGRPARRPLRTVLENRNLQALGLNRMLPWRTGLEGVLERLKKLR
jgi:dTDP-4-dehydrorhamnose reductase